MKKHLKNNQSRTPARDAVMGYFQNTVGDYMSVVAPRMPILLELAGAINCELFRAERDYYGEEYDSTFKNMLN